MFKTSDVKWMLLDYMSSNDYIYVVFSHFVMKLVASQHYVCFH